MGLAQARPNNVDDFVSCWFYEFGTLIGMKLVWESVSISRGIIKGKVQFAEILLTIPKIRGIAFNII